MTAIIDIEADDTNSEKAKLKYFGGLDNETGEVTLFDYKRGEQIKDYIKKHKIIIGFNFKSYDKVILEKFGVDFKYHVIIDLWECLAPKGDNGFGEYNKDRLHDINPGLVMKNYKLKIIITNLKLDETGKEDIDYKIFQKDGWDDEETEKIEKYLKQDLIITNKLFNWYKGIFESLKDYIPQKEFENYKHLTCTSGSLAYKIVCFKSGLKEEFNSREEAKEIKKQSEKIEGGHHIHPRWEKVRGNIICRDFVSHYPSILIMHKLLQEKISNAVCDILNERIKAKAGRDKAKALALKIPINSIYGILGNPIFKSLYDAGAAAEITRIGRELLRRYAKTLDIAGFIPLYGFTDSVYIGIPKELTEEDINLITDFFIETIKKEVKNPINSFNLEIDKRIKFIWFIEKKDNNYLYVTKDNKIEIKGGIFDINTSKCITQLFVNYISKKIISGLDVSFSKEELLEQLRKILITNPELAAKEYSVKVISSYNSKTSLQYQISERYGSGNHALIPNTSNIGIGRNQSVKYCSLEEFEQNNLTFDSIHLDKMMKYIKPFYSTKEEVVEL